MHIPKVGSFKKRSLNQTSLTVICLFKSFSIDSKEISFNRAGSLNDSRPLTIELNSLSLLGQLRLSPLDLVIPK